MRVVLLAALGVGGATMLGTFGGFLFRRAIFRHKKEVDAFSAGLMLVAAMFGLLEPALNRSDMMIAIVGIFVGALFLVFCDGLLPFLSDKKGRRTDGEPDRVFMLVMAIAVHNFPEGMAAGVGFGQLEAEAAMLIATEIAVQNLPEGMVIVGPMLASGVSVCKTVCYSCITALIEILGAIFGYIAVEAAYAMLPFTLSFAGGMMLYVIFEEMIPSAKQDSCQTAVTFSFFVGACLMMIFNTVL